MSALSGWERRSRQAEERPKAACAAGERRDIGSVLMLVPAAFLVLLVLAAITFDYSHLYLAERELLAVAEAAAQDAVTYGIDQAALRAGGGTHLDQSRVDDAVAQALAAHGHDLRIVTVRGDVVDDREVVVTLTATIDYIFVGAVPGAPKRATITVRASADAV